jgi:hypothetical protein
MPDTNEEKSEQNEGKSVVLKGTTLSVYRFMFREGRPVGPREIERGLKLSSVSIATYHLAKLLDAALIRETPEGYMVDKRMFENVVRLRRLLIPVQVSYIAFLAAAIVMLLTILRPPVIYADYYFSIAILLIALAISFLEARKAVSRTI